MINFKRFKVYSGVQISYRYNYSYKTDNLLSCYCSYFYEMFYLQQKPLLLLKMIIAPQTDH